MPSRRQLFEGVLTRERADLWNDLARALEADSSEIGDRVSDLVRRIRTIGEALGYPTDTDDIPVRCLPRWYGMVETVPTLGLQARSVVLDDIDVSDLDRMFIPERSTWRYYGDRNRWGALAAGDDDDDLEV